MGLARVNLALAGVVALLALAALYGPEPGDTLAEAPLTVLDPGKIRQIRIDRRGRDPIAFERDADGWGMTAPYRIAANGDKLQALARIASTPSHRSFPAGQADLAELGLAPASLHLELDGLTLEIGGTEPIRRRRYVRLEGRIHLIADLFQHHLLAAAAAFVAPTPFPTAIQSATLDGAPLAPKALHFLTNTRPEKWRAVIRRRTVIGWRSGWKALRRRCASAWRPKGNGCGASTRRCCIAWKPR